MGDEHVVDTQSLHLFSVEAGLFGMDNGRNINAVASTYSNLNSEQQHILVATPSINETTTTPAAETTNTSPSLNAAKHKKRQRFFYFYESDFFPSQYLNVEIDDVLEYCPLEKGIEIGMNAAAEHMNFANDDIQFAIQQSLMMEEKQKQKNKNNNNMEMVQLQSASAMSPYEMDLQ